MINNILFYLRAQNLVSFWNAKKLKTFFHKNSPEFILFSHKKFPYIFPSIYWGTWLLFARQQSGLYTLTLSTTLQWRLQKQHDFFSIGRFLRSHVETIFPTDTVGVIITQYDNFLLEKIRNPNFCNSFACATWSYTRHVTPHPLRPFLALLAHVLYILRLDKSQKSFCTPSENPQFSWFFPSHNGVFTQFF